MNINGEKIILKHITKRYTPLVVKWRNKENVKQSFIFQETFTNQMHNNWIDTQVNAGKAVQFIIFDKSCDKPVGSVFLRDIDLKNQNAEYGIFIGDDSARGKGFGTEAAQLICNYGFFHLELHKIRLRVFSDNEIAIRSYEKAGFLKEAYLKDEIKINNNFKSIILMAKFKDIN